MKSQSVYLPGDPEEAPASLSAPVILASTKVLFESVCSSLLLVTPDGRIAFANRSAEEMIGCQSDSLCGVEVARLLEPKEGSTLLSTLMGGPREDAGAPDTATYDGRLHCVNGIELPVRMRARAVRVEAGEEIGHVVTIEDQSDYVQMSEYVKLMAHHDLQTGLPKVETILSKVDAAVLRFHASGMPFALAEIGIEHFRRITESLGYDAGNGALREIGKRLCGKLESTDSLTRSGGEGFMVLFTDCPTEAEAVRRASALMRSFDEPFQIDDYCFRITANLGMSFSRDGKVTQNSVFSECELALRRSKSLGGNALTCFEPAMADWHAMAIQMESQMQAALQREEFFVVYQPQICLKTGKLKGVEALLRWNSPTHGLIVPNVFIPIAEETGIIVPLGEWCLRTACREVVELQKRLGYLVTLAVNVSPKQARAKGFREVVQNALETSGLKPECLEVEITEGLLISHEDEALRFIAGLQELGVSVAMDDFGMGFSNLSYITRFRVDRLKIDRSFVGRCTDDRSSRMITTSIMFLAKSLGIEVVAEGVETEEQASMLAGLECESAQGYLYSKPTTADEIFKRAQQFNPPQPIAASAESNGRLKQGFVSKLTVTNAPAPELSTKEAAPVAETQVRSKPVLPVAAANDGFGEARDPLCRPVYPPRRLGATRVRVVTVAEEEADAFLLAKSARAPEFKLLQ